MKAASIDLSTLGILGAQAIPYDSTKVSSVTVIDTGLYFGTKKIKIAYRCYSVSTPTPGTYSLLASVDFTGTISGTNVGNIVNVQVTGRYAPSNDFMATGSDVAGVQRLSCKFSASTFKAEVWGMYNSATAATGVVSVTYLE